MVENKATNIINIIGICLLSLYGLLDAFAYGYNLYSKNIENSSLVTISNMIFS